MKTTINGYRISKNGSILMSVEKDAFKSTEYLGVSTKQNGVYYYFERKQGQIFIYLP